MRFYGMFSLNDPQGDCNKNCEDQQLVLLSHNSTLVIILKFFISEEKTLIIFLRDIAAYWKVKAGSYKRSLIMRAVEIIEDILGRDAYISIFQTQLLYDWD